MNRAFFQRNMILSAFAIALAAFCLLFGYECIRSASKSILIEAFGPQNTLMTMSVAMAGVPLMVFLLIYMYGQLLSRFGANMSLLISTVFSAVLILICYFFILDGSKTACVILFLFRKSYIVILIEQYWSFVNSVLKPDFARRFNGFFLGISAIGATAGTWAGEKLVTTLGTERMLIFTVVSLIAAAVFSLIAYRVGGEPKPNEKEIGGRQGHAGIGLFFKSRYLLFLGLLIFVTQILSTALELRFDVLMAEEFSNKDLRSEYLYGFWYKVNIIAFCLNFLVAPLILPLLQIRLIKLFIPIIHLSVNLASILAPSLGTATLSLLLFKSLDYSIFRASKEILYMPLSYDARYRAKQLIDSLIYRNGEGLTAGVNALIDVVFVIPIVVYPVTAITMSFLWIGIVLNLTRQYQNLVSSS